MHAVRVEFYFFLTPPVLAWNMANPGYWPGDVYKPTTENMRRVGGGCCNQYFWYCLVHSERAQLCLAKDRASFK